MKIVLFDMDGTLTPARKKMTSEICRSLRSLQKIGFNVGIVTGSGINYIIDQCDIMFDIGGLSYDNLDLYPCNGTQHFKINDQCRPTLIYENKFIEKIGAKKYSQIIYNCLCLLSNLEINDWSHTMPLTGNFIDCRGSMINFCPIGRNASAAQREAWKSLDRKHKIRLGMIETLEFVFANKGISFKLGGETSIDIFPTGWDKTYVLKNFDSRDNIWFVGDRCKPPGNDSEIYEKVKKDYPGQAYESTGPEHTVELIKKIISYSAMVNEE